MLTREIEESKEPSSEGGADGMVMEEPGIERLTETRVVALRDGAEGAGGIITEEAARDSSLPCSSACIGSATTMLE